MRIEAVEIYSDQPPIMRHPGRRFPGALIQGDDLYALCAKADRVCTAARDVLPKEAFQDLNDLRNSLWARLTGYKSTLAEHSIEMPFSEVS